jgi:hypothetical protein
MDKQKRKLKLNLFDIIIIAAAIVAAVVFLRVTSPGGAVLATAKTVTLRYVVELANMPEGTAARIAVGDKVVDKVEKHELGAVAEVSVAPDRVMTRDNDTGRHFLTIRPTRETATLTIEVVATDTDRALTTGGFELRVGTSVSVTGPGWSGVGYIVAMDRGN